VRYFYVSSKTSEIRRRLIRMTITLTLVALLSLVMSFVSCSSKSTTQTTIKPNTTTTTSTPRPISTPTTPKVTTKTTTPTLNQASFTLSITPPQTYAEYTLPIYLTSESIIHLVWTVSGNGEHIRMAFNTPDGQYIGVKTNNGFVTLTNDKPCDQLNRSGGIVLNPSNQKWVDGYYVFHTYIYDQDPTVTVKLLYWIEQ
jgi:hypothetical protein